MDEKDSLERLQHENARLRDENARLRAQLYAAISGDPHDAQYVMMDRATLRQWAEQLRTLAADQESGCCRDCGEYLATMPHGEDCGLVSLENELQAHAVREPIPRVDMTPELDSTVAREATLRSMGMDAREKSALGPVWDAAWRTAVRACAIARGPDQLTAEDWVKLRNWAQDDNRALANTAFTAGAARDAATAFEMAFSKDPLLARPSVMEALHETVAALYFDDNSKYGGALWNIVRSLSPSLWQLLQDNPREAYAKAAELTRQSLAAEITAPSADARRWHFIASRNSCEVRYAEYSENNTIDVTLYLGSFNPLPYIKQDAYGHARLTVELIDAAMRHRS